MAKTRSIKTQCPMDVTINAINGKWKLSILWHLKKGVVRFNELQRLLSPITQKTLTLQLKELERDGIIVRTLYPEVPPKVEYALSPLGETLIPILDAMCQWGKAHQRDIPAVIEKAVENP